MIRMSLPDVIDRACITQLKQERTGENFLQELHMLHSEFARYSFKARRMIDRFYEGLLQIHSDIWYTEASIREADEQNMGLEEVGRRALIVRDLNRKRQVLKNEMIDYFGDGFKDCKVNYSRGKE